MKGINNFHIVLSCSQISVMKSRQKCDYYLSNVLFNVTNKRISAHQKTNSEPIIFQPVT